MAAKDFREHQFKPGQSGNPHGRPIGFKRLFRDCLTDEERKTIINAIKAKAMKGDLKAAEMLMDREDRRPTQSGNMNQNKPIMPIVNDAGMSGPEIDALMESAELRDELEDRTGVFFDQ